MHLLIRQVKKMREIILKLKDNKTNRTNCCCSNCQGLIARRIVTQTEKNESG